MKPLGVEPAATRTTIFSTICSTNFSTTWPTKKPTRSDQFSDHKLGDLSWRHKRRNGRPKNRDLKNHRFGRRHPGQKIGQKNWSKNWSSIGLAAWLGKGLKQIQGAFKAPGQAFLGAAGPPLGALLGPPGASPCGIDVLVASQSRGRTNRTQPDFGHATLAPKQPAFLTEARNGTLERPPRCSSQRGAAGTRARSSNMRWRSAGSAVANAAANGAGSANLFNSASVKMCFVWPWESQILKKCVIFATQ